MGAALGVVKDFIAAYEAGDISRVGSLLADQFVFSGPVPQPMNKERFVQFVTANKRAFPDWSFHARDFQEAGDTVQVTFQITGTHHGELNVPIPGAQPVPATGKAIKLAEQHPRFAVQNGKIVSITDVPNPDTGVPGILRQLDVPMPQ